MSPARRVLASAVAGLCAVVLLVGLNSLATTFGLAARVRSPEALADLLAASLRVFRPEGEGPFPTAILFSGCDDPRDNLDRLARRLNEAAWAAIGVDSHGPRGLDSVELWRLVCAGKVLPGPERAADVAVALAEVRAMPFVDPRRLALIGASYGGWAVLDLLSLKVRGRLPFGLAGWPEEGAGRRAGRRPGRGRPVFLLRLGQSGVAARLEPGDSRPVPARRERRDH